MAKTLGKILWGQIEKPQGYAFIADGMDNWPDEKVIERAINALAWECEAVKVLKNFVSRYAPNKASTGRAKRGTKKKSMNGKGGSKAAPQLTQTVGRTLANEHEFR